MLLNNGEYSEAVLRFEELAAYKDSCKLRIKALAHIDLRNAVISFYQNFSDAVSMAAKDIKYSQKVYTLLADCDLREEVLISRTGNLFVRFAIGTIVDVDGISYEVGLQYSLEAIPMSKRQVVHL